MKRTWSRENEAYLEQRKWSILGAEKMKRTWSRENETYLEQRNVLYSHTTNIFVHYIRISKGPLIWWFTLFPKKAINTQKCDNKNRYLFGDLVFKQRRLLTYKGGHHYFKKWCSNNVFVYEQKRQITWKVEQRNTEVFKCLLMNSQN